jgi:hypothetical protein
MPIDVTTLGDKNVIKKEVEKILKYKDLSNIPGKQETKELQKRAILGTAYILQRVLM